MSDPAEEIEAGDGAGAAVPTGTGAALSGAALSGATVSAPADQFHDGRDASAEDAHAANDADAADDARRNPPRDWAAPPPWLASSERPRDDDGEPPPFVGRRSAEPGQGLAGSAADRLAGGPPPLRRAEQDDDVWSSDSRSAAAAGAGNAATPARRAAPPPAEADDEFDDQPESRRSARRPRAYAQHLGGPDGPDWEHPRRYEAYPTIKTRVGLPAVPRVAALFGLVIVLALALFFLLPGILNIGGSTSPAGSSPKASVVAGPTASLTPTIAPAPTATVYTIKKRDTLSKIATAHGITIEELLAANPTIKDPNKISEGQQIIIPLPSAAPPDTVGESAAP